ncbi:putative deoxyribonuclease tatdn3 [Phlyctochytrium bullatum]|nr:putative deoxyribonuclease tatdn3 [Phlyctochytrium bullatum]
MSDPKTGGRRKPPPAKATPSPSGVRPLTKYFSVVPRNPPPASSSPTPARKPPTTVADDDDSDTPSPAAAAVATPSRKSPILDSDDSDDSLTRLTSKKAPIRTRSSPAAAAKAATSPDMRSPPLAAAVTSPTQRSPALAAVVIAEEEPEEDDGLVLDLESSGSSGTPRPSAAVTTAPASPKRASPLPAPVATSHPALQPWTSSPPALLRGETKSSFARDDDDDDDLFDVQYEFLKPLEEIRADVAAEVELRTPHPTTGRRPRATSPDAVSAKPATTPLGTLPTRHSTRTRRAVDYRAPPLDPFKEMDKLMAAAEHREREAENVKAAAKANAAMKGFSIDSLFKDRQRKRKAEEEVERLQEKLKESVGAGVRLENEDLDDPPATPPGGRTRAGTATPGSNRKRAARAMNLITAAAGDDDDDEANVDYRLRSIVMDNLVSGRERAVEMVGAVGGVRDVGMVCGVKAWGAWEGMVRCLEDAKRGRRAVVGGTVGALCKKGRTPGGVCEWLFEMACLSDDEEMAVKCEEALRSVLEAENRNWSVTRGRFETVMGELGVSRALLALVSGKAGDADTEMRDAPPGIEAYMRKATKMEAEGKEAFGVRCRGVARCLCLYAASVVSTSSEPADALDLAVFLCLLVLDTRVVLEPGTDKGLSAALAALMPVLRASGDDGVPHWHKALVAIVEFVGDNPVHQEAVVASPASVLLRAATTAARVSGGEGEVGVHDLRRLLAGWFVLNAGAEGGFRREASPSTDASSTAAGGVAPGEAAAPVVLPTPGPSPMAVGGQDPKPALEKSVSYVPANGSAVAMAPPPAGAGGAAAAAASGEDSASDPYYSAQSGQSSAMDSKGTSRPLSPVSALSTLSEKEAEVLGGGGVGGGSQESAASAALSLPSAPATKCSTPTRGALAGAGDEEMDEMDIMLMPVAKEVRECEIPKMATIAKHPDRITIVELLAVVKEYRVAPPSMVDFRRLTARVRTLAAAVGGSAGAKKELPAASGMKTCLKTLYTRINDSKLSYVDRTMAKHELDQLGSLLDICVPKVQRPTQKKLEFGKLRRTRTKGGMHEILPLIDCHAHFYPPNFDPAFIAAHLASETDASTLLPDDVDDPDAAASAGPRLIPRLDRIVLTPESPDEFDTVLSLCTQHSAPRRLVTCVGVHPCNAVRVVTGDNGGPDLRRLDDVLLRLRELLPRDAVVGVGEVGLDFSPWVLADQAVAAGWTVAGSGVDAGTADKVKDLQREVFRRQAAVAGDHVVPVNVHSRNAGHHAVAVLEGLGSFAAVPGGKPRARCLLHAFDGSPKHAERAVRVLDAVFSVAPILARDPGMARWVTRVGLGNLVLESDAPALPEVKGERNTPGKVKRACGALAERLGVGVGEVAGATWRNAVEVFFPGEVNGGEAART